MENKKILQYILKRQDKKNKLLCSPERLLSNTKVILGIISISLMTAGFACYKSNAREIVYRNSLEYLQTRADNPLSGFVPWGGQKVEFPHSMEYYSFPLNIVQKSYTQFDWSSIETALNNAKNNGNQAIIRFYIDYPGQNTGIPQFLLDNGLTVYEYDLDGDKGLCPDYNDINLQKALINFITAFGQKYDGDPRIGFIECGLLGFWGEWHTYPYSEWYPSADTYKIISTAFDNNFNKTKIMIGEPEICVKDLSIGYHDDMFIKDTEYYSERLMKNGLGDKWMYEAIGSELAPEIQEYYFEEPRLFVKNEFNDDDIMSWKEAVSLLHSSWCLNNEIVNYTEEEKINAISAAKNLGYDFTVTEALIKQSKSRDNHEDSNGKNSVSNSISDLNNRSSSEVNKNDDWNNSGSGDSLEISVNLKNIGNAPFYYSWNIELKIADDSGMEILRESAPWDITSVKELNKDYIFTNKINNVNLEKGRKYVISMKIINPMDGGKNLLFSNKEQNIDGWLELIEFTAN